MSVTIDQVSPFSIAQITDTHLFIDEKQELLGLRTTKSFQAVIEKLQHLQPQLDLLLLTGDLSQDGTPESYENVQNLLNPLALPTYWLAGNHDCISAMQQILNRPPFSLRKAFTHKGWNFLLINSGVPGCVHGYLSPEKLNWLNFALEIMGDRPTLVALHHPPFCLNSDWLDTSTLQNSKELFGVLDCHPQVKLVLFGHIHQEFHCQRNGVHYLGSPSTSIQFQPQSAKFSLDYQQPGFRLLNLHPDGRWETKIERVDFGYQLDLAATGY